MKKKTENLNVVYCGPTIINVAKQYTAFTNGLSPELKAIVTKHPLIKELVVPVAELAATRMALKDPSSPASLIYAKAEELLKGGN